MDITVIMVSWTYSHVQTHQIEYIKYGQFFLYLNYISIKLFKNTTEKTKPNNIKRHLTSDIIRKIKITQTSFIIFPSWWNNLRLLVWLKQYIAGGKANEYNFIGWEFNSYLRKLQIHLPFESIIPLIGL